MGWHYAQSSSSYVGDDTVMLAEDERGINNALKAMETYCDRWKLTVGKLKSLYSLWGKIM